MHKIQDDATSKLRWNMSTHIQAFCKCICEKYPDLAKAMYTNLYLDMDQVVVDCLQLLHLQNMHLNHEFILDEIVNYGIHENCQDHTKVELNATLIACNPSLSIGLNILLKI